MMGEEVAPMGVGTVLGRPEISACPLQCHLHTPLVPKRPSLSTCHSSSPTPSTCPFIWFIHKWKCRFRERTNFSIS